MSDLAEKEAELDAARQALAAIDPTPGGNSRKKRHAQRVDSRIRRMAQQAETVRHLERELAAPQRAEVVPVEPPVVATPDTVEVGDFITTRYEGWRRVVRVNRKTVSVETGHSWTDTVPYAKILRHRPAAS